MPSSCQCLQSKLNDVLLLILTCRWRCCHDWLCSLLVDGCCRALIASESLTRMGMSSRQWAQIQIKTLSNFWRIHKCHPYPLPDCLRFLGEIIRLSFGTVRDWSYYKFTNPTRTKASATPTKGSTTATETAEGEVDAKAWFGTNASIASILSTPSGLVGNCSTEFAIAILIDSCREMSVKNTCHIMPLSVSCSQLQVSAQFMIAQWGWRSLKPSLRTSSEFFLSCPSAGKYALPQWSGDRTFMRLTVLVGLAICWIVSFVTLEQSLSMMSTRSLLAIDCLQVQHQNQIWVAELLMSVGLCWVKLLTMSLS